MAQRQKMTGNGAGFVFPPEASDDFDVVETNKIAEWRKALNKEFGIGKGKFKVIEEPVAAD
ncbi:hypothetical protein [Aliiroseovarius crassostreae]|uniref:hypothetical protein n=1 Tax=Aliiroseovarius crassostreae TaxID=154981 RepID=UPI002208B62B|nr:hypothetical protein [Aliiroseovarius crassostreae]UWQ03719.1 hypothetical protein K3X22_08310 [Aliiroseovarius crassostreae]